MAACILFDLDGTLVDTAPDFIFILNLLLSRRDKPQLPAQHIRAKVSGGAREIIASGFGESLSAKDQEELLSAFLQEYQRIIDADKSQAVIFDGFRQVLSAITQARLPWGIVTNKPERYAKPLVPQLDLAPDVLVCPEHVSRAKPDPESILLACQRLGCQPEQSIYVGDHERDIAAGRAAGLKTIAVAWGYLTCANEHRQWQADFIATEPQDLISFLP